MSVRIDGDCIFDMNLYLNEYFAFIKSTFIFRINRSNSDRSTVNTLKVSCDRLSTSKVQVNRTVIATVLRIFCVADERAVICLQAALPAYLPANECLVVC